MCEFDVVVSDLFAPPIQNVALIIPQCFVDFSPMSEGECKTIPREAPQMIYS